MAGVTKMQAIPNLEMDEGGIIAITMMAGDNSQINYFQ